MVYICTCSIDQPDPGWSVGGMAVSDPDSSRVYGHVLVPVCTSSVNRPAVGNQRLADALSQA